MLRLPRTLRTALVLASTATSVVLACSDDSSRSDDDASGGSTAASAGASGSAGRGASGQTGAGGTTGSAGTASGAGTTSQAGTGATAGAASTAYTLGDVIEFVPGPGEVPYALGDNPYGIHGGAFLARAPNGNVIAVADEPGKICISGTLEEVPNGDYTGYWGLEVGFNLNQVPVEGGGEGGAAGATGAAGAGGAAGEAGSGSAGAPQDAVEAWTPGQVVGFSFVIEGTKIGPIRFKSLPFGLDPALESSVFCKPIMATSGTANDSLFTQMMQGCWDTASMTPLPLASGLANISWQLPADVNTGLREFDWCLSDLRPLLMK